jgi:hypothetical protein
MTLSVLDKTEESIKSPVKNPFDFKKKYQKKVFRTLKNNTT